jgi:hypothetical protein|mmetsp:Transcript_16532/g.51413  ORF Transcript_16532/g.51413 Transcript_16532/m.51413 type:complete len:102 (-) Transcript_16532:556-861(-)
MVHTILLLQEDRNQSSRHWREFKGFDRAVDDLCSTFEKRLKELNPSVKQIKYDISDLYTWVDSMPDLGAMVLDTKSGKYEPKNKGWIKQKIFERLKQQAMR